MSSGTDARPGRGAGEAPGPDPAHLQAIEHYYDETWFDYRCLWMNDRNRALHFGWWDDRVRTHAESLTRMNEVMAERAGITAEDTVLDAGCGVGGSSFWLAEALGVQVCGITIAAEQVLRARRYARERGVTDLVRFEQQDYTATTFADGSFSVLWAQDSFCHAADKPAFLGECHRLLRPGGRLVMHDYLRVDGANGSRRGPRALQDMLDGWVLPSLASADEVRRWAERAGLVDVVVQDVSGSVAPSLRRLYRTTLPFAPFLGWLHRRGWRSDAQHGNTVGSLAQWRAFRRGQWFPAIVTAGRR